MYASRSLHRVQRPVENMCKRARPTQNVMPPVLKLSVVGPPSSCTRVTCTSITRTTPTATFAVNPTAKRQRAASLLLAYTYKHRARKSCVCSASGWGRYGRSGWPPHRKLADSTDEIDRTDSIDPRSTRLSAPPAPQELSDRTSRCGARPGDRDTTAPSSRSFLARRRWSDAPLDPARRARGSWAG